MGLGVQVGGVLLQEEASETLHAAQGGAHVVGDTIGEGFEVADGFGELCGALLHPALQLGGLICEAIPGFAQGLFGLVAFLDLVVKSEVRFAQLGCSLEDAVFQFVMRTVAFKTDLVESLSRGPDRDSHEEDVRKAQSPGAHVAIDIHLAAEQINHAGKEKTNGRGE